MKKRKWHEEIEYIVDRIMPALLILLAVLIFIEFFHLAPEHEELIFWADSFIIAFFILDLGFKWHHTRNKIKFFKLYWIDCLAVFPFYAIFRVYALTTELVAAEQAQKFLHEAVLVRETQLLKEAEVLRVFRETQAARLFRQGRLIRLSTRMLRVLRARWYIVHWHFQKLSTGYRRVHKRR